MVWDVSEELKVWDAQIDLIRSLFKWIRQLGVLKGSGCYGGGSGLQSLYILLAVLLYHLL